MSENKPIRSRLFWTEAEDATLRELYTSGKTLDEISKTMKRSQKSIYYRATQNLHLKRPHKVKTEPQKVHPGNRKREYIDCIPNPFLGFKRPGFNVNFYRV